jgi:hypothetical protein
MLDFLTPEYYQRIARTLEDGKIQMAFFGGRPNEVSHPVSPHPGIPRKSR